MRVAAVARNDRVDRARQHDLDRTSSATGYGDGLPHRGNGDAQHARGSPFLCRAIRGGVPEDVCHDDSGVTPLGPVLVTLARRARSSSGGDSVGDSRNTSLHDAHTSSVQRSHSEDARARNASWSSFELKEFGINSDGSKSKRPDEPLVIETPVINAAQTA